MVFKRFKTFLILYLMIIVILSALATYILISTYFWLAAFWIFIILIFILASLVQFIRKEHLKLANFIQSIEQGDLKAPYSKNFDDLDLNNAFQKLSNVISTLRDNAHINAQYLQTIINVVKTSIICLDENNRIVLYNNSAKILFRKSILKDIDSLKATHKNLTEILTNFKIDDKKLIKLDDNGELYNYSIQLAKFKIRDNSYKLFTFQNVQSELEDKELESWQKLTRTLTHEIMNSAIPISNLSGFVYNEIFNTKDHDVEIKNKNKKTDIQESLSTIERRSKGLVNFVNATRDFTKMPKLELKTTLVHDVIKKTVALLKNKIDESNISVVIEFKISESTTIKADVTLIEQALINILLNAIEILENTNRPKIKISVFSNQKNQLIISVQDNGPGITTVDMENIFVPFFTTKKQGSGIGLSLSKQIMFLHKGNLTVKSIPGNGATFNMIF